MYKLTLTYNNYNDEEVTEDLYFNLSKAELLEMNFQAKGGLENYLRSIINARDTATLSKIFKELLLKSYGEKTPDGKHFMKNDTIRNEFECSVPFEELYTKFSTNAEAAAEFINNIIPKEIREKYAEMEKDGTLPSLENK
jgi:hypothetical protein